MSILQKILKWLVIAFAVYLGSSIISEIFNFFSITSTENNIIEKNTLECQLVEFDDVSNLQIMELDNKTSNIVIVESETFKIESDNKFIEINKDNNNKISIKEKNRFTLFGNRPNTNIYIYLPNELVLNNLTIKSEFGKLSINGVKTNNLNMELGAGNVSINSTSVLENVKINGGAGEIDITNSNLNNLQLKLGVGACNINSVIRGKNIIEAGIGEINIKLPDDVNEYKFFVEKGIGSIYLNEEKVIFSENLGKGDIEFSISGGIGKINIFTSYKIK